MSVCVCARACMCRVNHIQTSQLSASVCLGQSKNKLCFRLSGQVSKKGATEDFFKNFATTFFVAKMVNIFLPNKKIFGRFFFFLPPDWP